MDMSLLDRSKKTLDHPGPHRGFLIQENTSPNNRETRLRSFLQRKSEPETYLLAIISGSLLINSDKDPLGFYSSFPLSFPKRDIVLNIFLPGLFPSSIFSNDFLLGNPGLGLLGLHGQPFLGFLGLHLPPLLGFLSCSSIHPLSSCHPINFPFCLYLLLQGPFSSQKLPEARDPYQCYLQK